MLLQILRLPAILAYLTATISALALPQYNPSSPQGCPNRLSIPLPSSDLPSPSSLTPAVSLRYITLGIGTQNYTCSSTPNSGSAPSQVGARAQLYDIAQLLQHNPALVPLLPRKALAIFTSRPATEDVSRSIGIARIGEHFFNSLGQPTFDLYRVSARLVGKKLAGVPAPADADPGPECAGAIDWLLLGDAGGGASFGDVAYGYRVETAGGKPPATCEGQTGTFEVPYASEYWFYGP